jgi:hypothetical protein
MPDPTLCKLCGEPVLLAVTERGNLTLDPQPERRFVFVDQHADKPRAEARDTYANHLETCTANKHRRNK